MSVTPSEWALLRALAWHRVMPVRDFSAVARMLRDRRYLSMDGRTPLKGRTVIRITDAGSALAAQIEKELNNDHPK